MYYRHHSRHWLQQWFNARFLMTPLLTLVFWDLTPTGRWPLKMMKTLISCILDNTGLLRKPWILPLQRRMWCRGCSWVGALPGHVLPPKRGAHQLHQPRVPSSQDSQVRSRSLHGWLHLLDRSLALWSEAHLFSCFLKDASLVHVPLTSFLWTFFLLVKS